jgi:hypothetical protein
MHVIAYSLKMDKLIYTTPGMLTPCEQEKISEK